jgi:sterol desaturase/sphingolipid hydroxylase (fatty acid hydroxylase superfamily)
VSHFSVTGHGLHEQDELRQFEDEEANCNFGFNLPCWDRAFGT